MRPLAHVTLVLALVTLAIWLTQSTTARVAMRIAPSSAAAELRAESDAGLLPYGRGASSFWPAYVRDAGTIDAGPEPEPTGRATRMVVDAVCARAAALVCGARERLGCTPTLASPSGEPDRACRDVIAEDCPMWAALRYDSVPDDVVIDEDALRACFETLAWQAHDGDTLWADTVCVALVRDPAREGEPCTYFEGPCGQSGLCQEGRCRALPAEGEPCDELPCASDLACEAGLCVPPTPTGGACDLDTLCAAPNDACVDGRCTPLPDPTCATAGSVVCPRGERCDGLDRCVPATGACHVFDDCGRGTYCDGEPQMRCLPSSPPDWVGRRREGEPCRWGTVAPEDRCGGGLSCAAHDPQRGPVCARVPAVGPACDGLTVCPAGASCQPWVAEGRCMPDLCAQPDPFADYGEE